jgi:hypothetical protein
VAWSGVANAANCGWFVVVVVLVVGDEVARVADKNRILCFARLLFTFWLREPFVTWVCSLCQNRKYITYIIGSKVNE